MPFCVYFDFETTTGSSAFFYSKMYVVSNCQIVSSNPALNLDKIVIYREAINKHHDIYIYDMSHFKSEHVPFFDKTALSQLKDVASAVLCRDKCTSLAELFSVKLKFTIDTLKEWFNKIIKPKFFEIDYSKKAEWRKKNPATSQTPRTVYDLPLDPQVENGWFNHIIKAKHLFLRNVYSELKISSMEVSNIEDYEPILCHLLNIYDEFEAALQEHEISDEIREFVADYETFQGLRDVVEAIPLRKRPFGSKSENFSNKIIAFLYSKLINFC